MKFLAIDLETTGRDPKMDQILEVAMVLVDTKKDEARWPKLHCLVRHDRYSGEGYAINMNARIFRLLAEHEANFSKKGYRPEIPVVHADILATTISMFLNGTELEPDKGEYRFTVTACGKNPQGFDIPFLLNHKDVKNVLGFRYRTIDPTILFTDWDNDDVLPSLDVCKQREGIPGEVSHNAMEDIMDTVNLLLKKIKQ